jgi:hypothetical protein
MSGVRTRMDVDLVFKKTGKKYLVEIILVNGK